jgi:hypothetical protein
MAAAIARHPIIIPVDYEFRTQPGAPGGGPSRPGDPETPPPGIGLQGGTHGQYVDWGAGTAVTLHGKERVVPEGEISGQAINITVVSTLDGREVARNQI